MTKQTSTTDKQPNKPTHHRVEPVVTTEATQEFGGALETAPGLLTAAGGDPVENQMASRLGDQRIPAVQRRALAGQIGEMQGNGHLQRLVESFRKSQTGPAPQQTGKGNGDGSFGLQKRTNGAQPGGTGKAEPVETAEPAISDEGLGGGGVPAFTPAEPPPNGDDVNGASAPIKASEDETVSDQALRSDNRAIQTVEEKISTADEGVCPVCGRRGKGNCSGCGQKFVPHDQNEIDDKFPKRSSLSGAVQLKPADYQHSADGDAVRQRMDRRIREAEEEGNDEDVSPDEAAKNIDRRELKQQQHEIGDEATPDVNRPAEAKPQVEQATQQAQEEVEKPPEPQAKGEEKQPAAKEKGDDQAAGAAEQAAGLAEQAFSTAEAQPEPETPPEVTPPEPVAEPVDAAGEPLPGDPGADAAVMDLAQQAQSLRQGGRQLQAQAAEARTNAEILRGNLQLVNKGISQAELGVEKSTDHLQFRREVVGQTKEALAVSEEKAAMVAEKAPGVSEKADEGKEDSGPMAQEAQETKAENAAKTPDDPEAAGKSQEQGQKINKVGDDAATMDDAISQTKDKAGSLAEDAARAAEMNSETRGKVDGMQETLGQTESRLNQMQEQNTQARSQMENLLDQPNQMLAQAGELNQQGQALIQTSFELEERLQQVQTDYEQGMSSVPALQPLEEPTAEEPGEALAEPTEAGAEETSIETPEAEPTTEESGYGDRETVDVTGEMPSWLTGVDPVSVEQREAATQEQEQRRQEQITEIEAIAGERGFESLDAGDKMAIALKLTGQNLFSSVSNIQWPGWGNLALMLIDPRSTLQGVVSGLGMMLSGAANLFNAKQWAKDPLENLLKSAADIATGLTIVLGSITALAGLIIGLMTAITIVSLGTAAPVTGPIIAFCTTVLTTVGGWTIAVGKVALILQALVFVKNLIDAATAETAEELQQQSDQMTEDVGNAAQAAMQIVGARGAQVGARNLQSRVAKAGGLRAYGRATARALPGRVAGGARAVGRGIVRGARAAGRGAVRGARAVGRGVARGARAVGRGARAAGRGISGTARRGWQATTRTARNVRDRVRQRLRRRAGAHSDVLSEQPTIDGHKIRLTPEGDIVRCSSCTNISLVYGEALDQNPKLKSRWDRIRNDGRKANQLHEEAIKTGNPKTAHEAKKLSDQVTADTARLERQLTQKGIVRGGQRYKPEPALLGTKKHGLEWEGGPRRLRDTGNSQGQFGSQADINFSVEKAAELGPGGEGYFDLPSGHSSFVHVLRNGQVTQVPAKRVFVKVRHNGVVHAYPLE